MPEFYFDVRERAELTPVNEGPEFGILEAAEGKGPDVTVKVRDEHGQQVLTVIVATTIPCIKPAPA